MSYSSNRRKKNRKQAESLMCNTFDEFCASRGRKAPIIMGKDEYNQEMRYWLSYKQTYEMELTKEEKLWALKNSPFKEEENVLE